MQIESLHEKAFKKEQIVIQNNPTNVLSAFEILLEEVEAEIEFVNRIGSGAFENSDYDKAKEALEKAGQLTSFRDQLVAMRKEWDNMVPSEEDEDEETAAQRRNLGRLQRGIRTKEESYYIPILTVLKESGGSGRMSDVIDRVGEIMKNVLQDVDYDPLASDPRNPRWRNTAQWARHALVLEGLMKKNSPRGIWEISDKGEEYLEDQKGK